MKPQITIDQLRLAIEKYSDELSKDENDIIGSSIKMIGILEILDIIDNPEKYKHLWQGVNVEDSRPKWRFKTKREFENEYGSEWRRAINPIWNPNGGMDHLLGWVIADSDYPAIRDFHKNGSAALSHGPKDMDNWWWFTTQMITPCDYTKGRVGDDGYWVEQ